MSDDIQQEDVNKIDDTIKPRHGWLWIQNSSGQASVTTTLLVISFWVTTLVYLASIFEDVLGIKVRPFDVGASAAYFAPILAAYAQRRWTEAKFKSKK
jgi:hypothetical protein